MNRKPMDSWVLPPSPPPRDHRRIHDLPPPSSLLPSPSSPACPSQRRPSTRITSPVLHRPDPMTPEAEKQARRRTCRFIEEAGQRSLRLPRVAVSTAAVFFHRFYARHAFQEHDRFEVAMACLLLAGKTEESPKKLEVVIRECWKLRRRAQQMQVQAQMQSRSMGGGGESPMAVASPGTMPSPTSTDGAQLDINSEEYSRLKERVLLLERIILHTIGFELSIDHPYKFLVDFVQEKKRMLEYSKQPSPSSRGTADGGQPPPPPPPLNKTAQYAQMVQELAQNAMNFANDSMHTSLCLQYTAREIALTCVYLSGKYSGIRPVGNRPWIELLDGITVEDLTTISIQILELVQPRKGMDSEMAFKMIRKDLDEMSAKTSDMPPDAKRLKTN
ncbi:hypothetical protein ACHAXA_000884 [Cyclostephanos tholiformis]|uniref:Cyclin-like domain-containing protein n=1 Tax=Cyclostephanos tholiformis TaxID=382380 RepID=A0ABD3R9Q1_9STRA